MKNEKSETSIPDRLLLDKEICTEKNFHELLLGHSYLDAVRSLAAGVTHNYNNIFSGLLGLFAMLRQTDLPIEEKEATFGLIDELLQRGRHISTNFSPFTRKTKEALRAVAPETVLNEASELLSLLSSSHRILTNAETNLPNLHCPPRQLLLALYNLGRNAIEAMPEGGTVEIFAQKGDDRFDPLPAVVFSIIDHGRGIAEEFRDRIFRPFFSTQQSGGNQEIGLGLYVAKDFAIQQQGMLEFDTVMGRGSIFRLILPAVPQLQGPEKEGHDGDHCSMVLREEESCEEVENPEVILVVGDEEALMSTVTRELQVAGHIVFSVPTGQEAIEEYTELHDTISTVIMDAGLSDMTGPYCVRRLMEIDPEMKVLYTSSRDLEGDELYPPYASLLLKPFSKKDLYKAVGNASKRNSTELS